MRSDGEPGFARGVREAYRRTPSGDAAARERLLERLARTPAPRRGPRWRDRVAAAFDDSRLRSALAAAGIVVLVAGVLIARREGPTPPADPREAAAPAAGGDEAVVRFELEAPGVGGVALVGDFNDWDPAATPMRRAAARDTWSVSLPVPRGRHTYAFVVDRARWLPDPAAPRAPEDGFGSATSVLVVEGVNP